MAATTGEKARLLDLMTGILELLRDGKRDIGSVSQILQVIKDNPEFLETLSPSKIQPNNIDSMPYVDFQDTVFP